MPRIPHSLCHTLFLLIGLAGGVSPVYAQTGSSLPPGYVPSPSVAPYPVTPYSSSPEFPVNRPESLPNPSDQAVGVSGFQPDAQESGVVPLEAEESVDAEAVTSAGAAVVEEEPQSQPRNAIEAEVILIDKVAARSTKMKTKVPAGLTLGMLAVKLEKCVVNPQVYEDEHAALLHVLVSDPSLERPEPEQIFSGWMFKKRPALTYVSHPYYDVKLVQCIEDPTVLKKVKEDQEKAEAEKKAKEEAEAAARRAAQAAQEAARQQMLNPSGVPSGYVPSVRSVPLEQPRIPVNQPPVSAQANPAVAPRVPVDPVYVPMEPDSYSTD